MNILGPRVREKLLSDVQGTRETPESSPEEQKSIVIYEKKLENESTNDVNYERNSLRQRVRRKCLPIYTQNFGMSQKTS